MYSLGYRHDGVFTRGPSGGCNPSAAAVNWTETTFSFEMVGRLKKIVRRTLLTK